MLRNTVDFKATCLSEMKNENYRILESIYDEKDDKICRKPYI